MPARKKKRKTMEKVQMKECSRCDTKIKEGYLLRRKGNAMKKKKKKRKERTDKDTCLSERGEGKLEVKVRQADQGRGKTQGGW